MTYATAFRNLTVERAFPKLNVFADPKLAHFPEVQLARAGGDLVIKGENLNLAAASRDVRVAIDGAPCNVTALSASTLTCQLPLKMRDDDLEVHVYVGDRAYVFLRFEAPNALTSLMVT